MLADLVEVTTEDGIALGGAYFAPTGSSPRQGPVEAVCFFHGDSGHFYRSLYLALGEHLAGHGIALLSANRRGHDTIANGPKSNYVAHANLTKFSRIVIPTFWLFSGWNCVA